MPWLAQVKSGAFCVTTTAAKTKLPREIQKIANAMRLTLHHRYKRLKTKQRRNQHRRNQQRRNQQRRNQQRRNQHRRNQHDVDRPVVRELDLTLDNLTDRALFQLGTLPTELRTTIIHHGPCRPKGPFAISSDNGNRRLFSDKNTTMHILGQWK